MISALVCKMERACLASELPINYSINDEFVDMLSRETKLIAGFMILAIVLLFGILSVSEPPT